MNNSYWTDLYFKIQILGRVGVVMLFVGLAIVVGIATLWDAFNTWKARRRRDQK